MSLRASKEGIIFIFKYKSLISFRLPLKLCAALVILFLVTGSSVLSYRGGVEIWGFLKKEYVLETAPGKIISYLIGITIGIATFVQSAPIIWHKFSNWGQLLDNLLLNLLYDEVFFLDQVEALTKKVRRKLDLINKDLLELALNLENNNYNKEKGSKILVIN